MKAEHRKELETNLLADRMGNLIQRVKAGEKRRWIINTILIVVVALALFIGYRIWQGNPGEETVNWIRLNIGDLDPLLKQEDNNYPEKGARFQYAHYLLWEQGVSVLGNRPAQALRALDVAERLYERLVIDCENDRELKSQALYGLAVIEETRAAVDIKKLSSAKQKYKDIVDEYNLSEEDQKKTGKKNTMEGVLAQARLDDLNNNSTALTDFYKQLNETYGLTKVERDRHAEEKAPPALKKIK